MFLHTLKLYFQPIMASFFLIKVTDVLSQKKKKKKIGTNIVDDVVGGTEDDDKCGQHCFCWNLKVHRSSFSGCGLDISMRVRIELAQRFVEFVEFEDGELTHSW